MPNYTYPFGRGANRGIVVNQSLTLNSLLLRIKNPPPPPVDGKLDWWMPIEGCHSPRSLVEAERTGTLSVFVGDIDSGNFSLEDVDALISSVFGSDALRFIHSTKSHVPISRRWRFGVQLAEAVPCRFLLEFHTAVKELLGIPLDNSLSRPNQYVYLPYAFPGYEYHIGGSAPAPVPESVIVQINSMRRGHPTVANATAETTAPYTAVLRQHHPSEIMRLAGFTPAENMRDWHHACQTTDSYATRINDDGSLITLSTSTRAWLGDVATPNGKFDVIGLMQRVFNINSATVAAYGRSLLGPRVGVADISRPDGGQQIQDIVERFRTFVEAETKLFFSEQKWCNGAPITEPAKHALAEAAAEELRRESEKVRRLDEAEKENWKGDWVKEIPRAMKNKGFKPSAMEALAWNAPGVLGDIVKLYARHYPHHSLVPFFVGAYHALSTTLMGNIVGRTKQYVVVPSMFVYLMGETGSGKGFAFKVFNDIMRELRKTHVKAAEASRFKSSVALEEFMSRAMKPDREPGNNGPFISFTSEEAANAMKAVGNKNNIYGNELHSTLLNYATSFDRVTNAVVGKASTADQVHSVQVSALYAATTQDVYDIVNSEFIKTGYIGRCIFFRVPNPPMEDTIEDFVLPEGDPDAPVTPVANRSLMRDTPEGRDIINRIKNSIPIEENIRNLDPNLLYMFDEEVPDHLVFRQMMFSVAAEAFFEHTHKEFLVNYGMLDKDIRGVANRAAEAMTRVGLVVAVSRLEGIKNTISLSDMQFAKRIVEQSLREITKKYEYARSKEEDEAPKKFFTALARIEHKLEEIMPKIAIIARMKEKLSPKELERWTLQHNLTRFANNMVHGMTDDKRYVAINGLNILNMTEHMWLRKNKPNGYGKDKIIRDLYLAMEGYQGAMIVNGRDPDNPYAKFNKNSKSFTWLVPVEIMEEYRRRFEDM